MDKTKVIEEKTPGWHEFHIAFFNVMDFEKFPQAKIIKCFVDAFLNDAVDIMAIKDFKTKAFLIDFLVECDRCASEGEKDLAKVAATVPKKPQRLTIEERAKKAGLHTVKARIPKQKKLIL